MLRCLACNVSPDVDGGDVLPARWSGVLAVFGRATAGVRWRYNSGLEHLEGDPGMSEPVTTDKQRMIQLLEGQPDDSSFEELIKELAFDRMVERGVTDAENGRTISHEELGRRMAAWQK